MNTREQFGGYLLLKKLAEDPLGETFRGGRGLRIRRQLQTRALDVLVQ